MNNYLKQQQPVKIPVPGNKIIEEHFGKVATKSDDFSLAHMQAPSGWSEPAQKPDFDEITIMVKGRMKILINDNEEFIINAGESFMSRKGVKIQYSNPFEEANEYWSVCIPAFSPETVNRQES
ncbi:MAG TPA: hypothetical protein VKA34_02300 [Balneolales bacterium]|nr:hypothetical protein [Balneolales bacterium]